MKIQCYLVGGALVIAGILVLMKESKWHRQFVDVTA